MSKPPLDWLLDELKSIIECIEIHYLEEDK